jgi:hypothetical protein
MVIPRVGRRCALGAQARHGIGTRGCAPPGQIRYGTLGSLAGTGIAEPRRPNMTLLEIVTTNCFNFRQRLLVEAQTRTESMTDVLVQDNIIGTSYLGSFCFLIVSLFWYLSL